MLEGEETRWGWEHGAEPPGEGLWRLAEALQPSFAEPEMSHGVEREGRAFPGDGGTAG